jgi:K+-transporting ATPase ATPase A chain
MTIAGVVQLGLYLVVVLALARPLGRYMARVYDGTAGGAARLLRPLERLVLRLGGVGEEQEMRWTTYFLALLAFHLFGLLAVYLLQRLQALLPLNPEGLAAVPGYLAWNTAISFVTNTNWQSYGGEVTLSYLVQMLGLTVQNFVSAASGMAVLVALVRGFTRRESKTIGSFWVDLTRSTVHLLLPLAMVLALLQTSQGVVQTLRPYQRVEALAAASGAGGSAVSERVIALGPASSQVAIKQLGTNGGGFFNANSSHPLENPTPLSNFLQLLSILLLAAALPHTFGAMVGDPRQGWALLAVMVVVFVPLLGVATWAEQSGNPMLAELGAADRPSALQAGGNMEGKEVRFGIASSALWATATTAASNGSVNSMHDSYTPLGGLVPMWLMQLGEVVFGGVGSGLYGLLLFAVVGIFVAGLMVGRTPEYLGKKIETHEMKMASLGILAPPAAVLLGTAIAVAVAPGLAGRLNTGAHGISQIL